MRQQVVVFDVETLATPGQLTDKPNRGLINSPTGQSPTGHFADWSTRALVNSLAVYYTLILDWINPKYFRF